MTNNEQIRKMLRDLSFPIQHCGYRRLCIAVPRFAEDPEQSLTKELYPYIAQELGSATALDVESSIRRSIVAAWTLGDRTTWEKFFPSTKKPPSNLAFIATLADYLQ